MVHHKMNRTDHWGVSVNAKRKKILVQVGDKDGQTRIALDSESCRKMVRELFVALFSIGWKGGCS